MTKPPKIASPGGDGEPARRADSTDPFGLLDSLRAESAKPQANAENPEWVRRREEFKADPKKLKAFLDRAEEAIAGPYRVRRSKGTSEVLVEFFFHFGKHDDTPNPGALRAALELADVWEVETELGIPALPFALRYVELYPAQAQDLWSAVRGRGTRGQFPALPWRVLRPLAALRWFPVEMFAHGPVLHPPSAETISALPELARHWGQIRDGVNTALYGLDAIRRLQLDRLKRHREAESELDRLVELYEAAHGANQPFDPQTLEKVRAAESRLLQVEAGPGSEKDVWFTGDAILHGPLLRDLGVLAVLAPRLVSHCDLIQNLIGGSQPAELDRSVKNLERFSKVAGELVLAVAREFPDARRGSSGRSRARAALRGGNRKTGIGREEVLKRARQILSLVYPQLGERLSDTDLKSRAQRAQKRAILKT